MDYGLHLPLIDFGYGRFSLDRLTTVTRSARDAGFALVAANDHLLFDAPWLDGPTALAAVAEHSGTMTLATTVALPVIRGAVPVAKAVAALDVLSGGRTLLGVGPGSSARDYEVAGIPFAERWTRFERAVPLLRDLLAGREGTGRLRPRPLQAGGPPIWIGSWGSEAGLRRVARLADGWLASAYHTTPSRFVAARERLAELLHAAGRDPVGFPNALATTFLYLTDHRADADRVLRQVLAPVLRRPVEDLADRLLVGPPDLVAERLAAYEAAGLQRLLLWPVADEVTQLERFVTQVTRPGPARHTAAVG